MTNIKEQTIPTAYSREVNGESTLKYMGEVITFLVLGNALASIKWISFPPCRPLASLTSRHSVRSEGIEETPSPGTRSEGCQTVEGLSSRYLRGHITSRRSR